MSRGRDGGPNDDAVTMREFLVLWGLREGPVRYMDLVRALVKHEEDDAQALDIVMAGLEDKDLVSLDEDGYCSLTQTGQALIENAPVTFTEGYMELLESCQEEE